MKKVTREEIAKAAPLQVSFIREMRKRFNKLEVIGIGNKDIYWVPDVKS